ncbi:MAG: DNA polymerase III subunit beta [Porticoccus sp.]|jgi:DNA polymerase-3 subunit beta|nr:DNA polymerase III subunit beta [Porticoccus sp.]|tara:strand:- start:569 stop:1666 length:1098 start_codon:yes stop_codon:yes gene_type:complete
MKFKISREDLLQPLQLVVGVVERRQTLPILSNVLIVVKDDLLSMTGTDLEVEIVGHVKLKESETEGEITVPARKLMDICRSLPESKEITFNEQDGKVQITCGRSRFMLLSLPAKEFPSIDEQGTGTSFIIDNIEINKLIAGTSFSMAQQDVRYYLNGMLLELDNNRVRAVATDGHRLAMMDSAKIELDSENVQAIIPRKAVMELSRLLPDNGEAAISISDNYMKVVSTGFRFTTKLIDGAYPDYDQVIPKDGDKKMLGMRSELLSGFSRAAILSNEKYRGVKLLVKKGLLTLEANNQQDEAREEVIVKYECDDLELGFNVSYIIDILNILTGEETCFTFSNAGSSVLIEDLAAPNSVYVVMPMRL